MKIMFVYAGFENLGIEYLSAVLKKHGHETRLAFDPRIFNDQYTPFKFLKKMFDYESEIIRQISDYKPDITAFSVVSSDYLWSLRIAKEIKKYVRTYVVFGGIHPSSVPEKVLKNDCVDFVIMGEGEHALAELSDNLEKGMDTAYVPNLCARKNNEISLNAPRRYIHDLDSLPFADKALYYDVLPEYASDYVIITRRGCRNTCSYCHNSVWKMRYPHEKDPVRLRSVENVIAELAAAKEKYKFRRLRINDDLFSSDEAWLKEFSAAYKAEINAPFMCSVSPETTNENIAGYLKEANCFQVCMGVQTINDRMKKDVLNRYEKKEQVIKAIKLYRDFKIRCVADNILGLPGEREEDLVEMANFYLENPVRGRIAVFRLIYFPNTPIVQKGLERGVLNGNMLEKLAEEPYYIANTVQGRFHKKELIRYHLLLLCVHFFPKWLGRWVVRKKIYNFFPLINPALIEIPYTMIARDRYDPERRRYYGRYKRFILNIFLKNIKDAVRSLKP